jgi:asparagine synthase (glutamine-hydrolysing)
MANSIESRLPFLDYKVVETALSLHHSHKIHEGWTKYVLRKIISPLLPKEVVWRKNKLGFNAPEKSWINRIDNQISTSIKESKILKELLDFDKINLETIDLRTKWRLYNFAKWEEIFKVST